jgi:sarcosine oxidase gamma subunit
LLVALDSSGGAKGDVFLDDGISINIARSAVFYFGRGIYTGIESIQTYVSRCHMYMFRVECRR